MKHSGWVPVAVSGSPSSEPSRSTSEVPVMNSPLGARRDQFGESASV